VEIFLAVMKKEADMRSKRAWPNSLPIWLILMVVLGIWWALPQTALAQCGDTPADSTCKTCHEESYPVYGTGEWHDIHARKDCCWNCHGGNSRSMDKEAAHAGMVLNPLTDTYQDCYACHPYDYDERATIFGAQLNVEPGVATPTPAEAVAPVRLPDEARELVILPTSQPGELSQLGLWLPVLSLIGLGILILVGLALARQNQSGHSSSM
jgi:hypothetical protein